MIKWIEWEIQLKMGHLDQCQPTQLIIELLRNNYEIFTFNTRNNDPPKISFHWSGVLMNSSKKVGLKDVAT